MPYRPSSPLFPFISFLPPLPIHLLSPSSLPPPTLCPPGNILAVLLHERKVTILRELFDSTMTFFNLNLHFLLSLSQIALTSRLRCLNNLGGVAQAISDQGGVA